MAPEIHIWTYVKIVLNNSLKNTLCIMDLCMKDLFQNKKIENLKIVYHEEYNKY